MATYLVTGANRGIGLEYCKQLMERGDEVIATCRSSTQELDDLGVRVEVGIDITSGESVVNLKNKLSGLKIDVLIQNAGVLERNSLLELDPENLSVLFPNFFEKPCFT